MDKRNPKPINDILSYLDHLGFDHVYVGKEGSPSTVRSVPVRSAPREPVARASPPPRTQAAVEVPSSALPTVTTPAIPAPSDGSSAALPIIPERPTPQQRAELFAAIRDAASRCTACRLAAGRTTVVFDSGRPDAELMLIGEAPGSQEDRQGLPFVGPAGALLTRILQAIDLRRDEVYITNVVKCRPPRNRDPEPDEVQACRGYLDRQVALVRPKLIVALGRVAAQALLNTSQSLGSLRGRWHQVQGVETRVTYHPAALLRNEKWKRPTWEDMKVVRDRLAAGK